MIHPPREPGPPKVEVFTRDSDTMTDPEDEEEADLPKTSPTHPVVVNITQTNNNGAHPESQSCMDLNMVRDILAAFGATALTQFSISALFTAMRWAMQYMGHSFFTRDEHLSTEAEEEPQTIHHQEVFDNLQMGLQIFSTLAMFHRTLQAFRTSGK